jgi:predicted NAD-dependent protein-ADP-ribosyltransferase YbiA (DUF1768 family)
MKIYILHILCFINLLACSNSDKNVYPRHWWKKIVDTKIPNWEILPQAGEVNKSVILSKRHELGILSNFAATPFTLNGNNYASVEGLWQATKYPDPELADDPRKKCQQFKLSRIQVENLTSFEAKAAGDAGTACMKELGIDWVSFRGKKMQYRLNQRGDFYLVILNAMKEKLAQNIAVQNVLNATKGLVLLPDHQTKSDDPPAWRYFEIWQEIRDQN